MEVRVRFRFNKVTGQVEVFEVEDEGVKRLPVAEHNREHDRIAAEVGNVIERNPRVIEVLPGTGVAVSTESTTQPASEEASKTARTSKEKQKQVS